MSASNETRTKEQLEEDNRFLKERVSEYMQSEEVQQVTIQALQEQANASFEEAIKLRAQVIRLHFRLNEGQQDNGSVE